MIPVDPRMEAVRARCAPPLLVVSTWTACGPLQVVEEHIPETEHDFSVDYIVTPDEVIACTNRRRPRGLVWANLTAEKIAEIPVLAKRRAAR
ncbi:hypothetical protein ACWGLO_06495 [Streptomyces niveus]